MKRLCLGLGITVGISVLSASAEEPGRLTPVINSPAASLGTPRPSGLGIPRAAPKPTSAGTETVPVGFPSLTVRGQSPEPLTPLLSVQNDPKKEENKKMPTAEIKESESPGKELPVPKQVTPVPSGPVVSHPVVSAPALAAPVVSLPAADCETPGCALPATAMPFVRGAGSGPGRAYGSAEYLMWWMKSYSIPILATTGPFGTGGVIGQPGVVPVLGGGNSDPTGRAGARVNLGWWFGPCRDYALDVNFFFLGDRGTDNSVNSVAFPLLARPFIVPNGNLDPNSPQLRLNIPGQFSEITALPGLQTGSITLHTDSLFWGGDIAVRRKWIDNCCGTRLDGLLGFRHLDLKENLEITETFTGLPGGQNAGLMGAVFDKFRTTNSFNGALVGLVYERQRGRWNFGATTRLGLGVTNQTLEISGGQTQIGPGAVTPTVPGGLLALNSNIGHFSKNRLSFIPEVGVTVGYDVTSRLQLTMGYNMIYWSNVLRPGDQIDTTLDLTRVPILNDPRVFPQAANVAPVRQVRPAAMLRESDLWVQGVSLGLKYVW